MINDDPHQYLRIYCFNCGRNFDVPVPCGNRFCPICHLTRRSRARKRIQQLLMNTDIPSGYSLTHLTLTISNQESLPEMVEHLIKSFRRLRQRKFWSKYVEGGCFVLEVTGRDGDWHAHIHSVIVCRFIPWKKLKEVWSRVSGGQGVYLRRITRKGALDYLTKYITKTELSEEAQIDASVALKGKRLFQPFGKWHDLDRKFEPTAAVCSNCGASCMYPYEFAFVRGIAPEFDSS